MPVPDAIAPLLRRWYVLLVGLLITIGLAYAGAMRAQPTYFTQASVLLIPAKVTIPEGGNLFLYLGGLGQARDVVVRDLGREDVHDDILRRTVEGDFAVSGDPTSSAPMITIRSTAPTASGAEEIRKAVLEALPATVTSMQDRAGAEPNARFKTFVVSDDSPAEADGKARFRMILAAVFVGTSATLLAAAMLDVALRGRRSSRRSRRARAAENRDDRADAPPTLAEDPLAFADESWSIEGRELVSAQGVRASSP
jgi:hypothetical protein